MESWIGLFQQENGLDQDNVFFTNSKRPTLNAWMFTKAPGEDTERAVAVRNPYYFKVDTEGTQLPYFDQINYQMVADAQVLLLKTLQGEIDMMDQYICTPTNKPVLFDGQDKGNYHFYTLKETAANVMVFQLNLNHTDEVKNALFNTKEFRQALSIAVDRQALIDAVFVGQGAPAQPSIIEGDPLYNETLAKQFTEYDPDKANQMLDAILPDKDSDGIRQGRLGAPADDPVRDRPGAADLHRHDAAGDPDVPGVSASTRRCAPWTAACGRPGSGTAATSTPPATSSAPTRGIAAMLDARYFVPFSNNSIYAPGWSLYYRDPTNEDAVEPPAEVKATQEKYKELLATADPSKQNEIFASILADAAEQFLVFGVSLPPDSYGVVKNDMVNTMPVMPNSFGWPTPGPSRPEQFFKA